ncbi:MAG: restriction endonuclease [Fibrobacteres bacterium]|nr:restriction endonuclease [Fibrobacterota bacterium]
MNYPSIRIEGSIFSPDILERLEDANGQKPSDFGLDPSIKVKDEIARAWADAQDYWRIFQRKLDTLKSESPATTETRNLWITPLLGLLGYQLEYQAKGIELNEKNYAISHRVINRGLTPVHIVGCREPAGLDRKSEKATLRMSAHAMLQEYLNLRDELYGIVTNGRILRLLRDSSRLVKLTYLEFDLDRIFTDGLFADFALLYRLLHVTRLPADHTAAADSIVEKYHQDSLDSGARIRDGLSKAVEQAIRDFGNGFLSHPANNTLRSAITSGQLTPEAYYQNLLRLIYRLLFLLVIEERNLVYPAKSKKAQRDIYDSYYSLQRLRRLSEKRYLADHRHHDLWLALLSNFRLFEAHGPGEKLGIAPLAGDLFGPSAIGLLNQSTLSNDILLGCIRSLGLYQHPDNKQVIRVNYAALNVEEFGSVYEGLLEYEPVFHSMGERLEFAFKQGDKRSATGSHYTPDDLVQPLIKHSLDYLIHDKLKEKEPEKALLSLRIADVTCGSGHILLAAARRVATELAVVRTGEEQPTPTAFRTAIRDVIKECIYGVDLNPLAVELCKVALWLEAHNPNEPLNFLDHHIKCGNAIVGFVKREELEKGIPDEAFTTMPGDDKEIAAQFRKQNKNERGRTQLSLAFTPEMENMYASLTKAWREFAVLPEGTPDEIEAKKARYFEFTRDKNAYLLSHIASIPIAQFYIPKTKENSTKLITDAEFKELWSGQRAPQSQATAMAWSVGEKKRFFNWFLEFPEIIQNGGFDCILGNPPYLGDKQLSGTYGYAFCEYVRHAYAPTGLSDLVVYFIRRIYSLLKPMGFTAFITTNSIKDGDIRKDGLEQIIIQGGDMNMAVRGIKWPGHANLVVSLVALHKGKWIGKKSLDGKQVDYINAYFEDVHDIGEPIKLIDNLNLVSTGTYFLGDGFLISNDDAIDLIKVDPVNADVISPLINGQEINNDPESKPGRSIINFSDWPIEKALKYQHPFQIVEKHVKPEREKQSDKIGREKWWQFMRTRQQAYNKIRSLSRCFASARTTKHLIISACPTNWQFSDAINFFTIDRWDFFTVIQSTLHEVWARRYSGALETRLRYSPSDCFETFPFPASQWNANNDSLAKTGEQYHGHRRQLMLSLWLGLTDIYNLFHTRGLTPAIVEKVSKKTPEESESGYNGILELRRLHVTMDNAVRDAYGWSDLDLGHDFHEVETLPENDRVRYTISPAARKEVLKRLLALNHERASEEAAKAEAEAAVVAEGKANAKGRKKRIVTEGQGDLFG